MRFMHERYFTVSVIAEAVLPAQLHPFIIVMQYSEFNEIVKKVYSQDCWQETPYKRFNSTQIMKGNMTKVFII